MSRKIKPNKLFDDAQKVDAEETIVKNEAIEASEAKMLGIDSNSIVGNGRMSAEDAEKLAKYDVMEKSLVALSEEKVELEAKVAEYLEKIDSLKDSSDKISRLEIENKELKDKVKSLEEKVKNASRLEKQITDLKDENDRYLVKISELTFDNANLTCQLSEIEKKAKANGNVSNQKGFMPATGPQQQTYNSLARPNRDAYNPYINNGYGTW